MRRWIRGRAPATTATCATSAGSWRRAMADQLEREDLEARVRALDERRSILLQAPAGSGKTSVLTQRFLRLLATVDDPGAILAVTFTRKAAAEMRARVIRALRGEVRADEPGAPELGGLAEAARQHARSRGRSFEEDTQALRIQTIDSFTYWLASQLPIAARAGGALEVTETPDELYRRAARRTLLTAEHDAALGADAALLFERLDNQWILVERLLAEMLEKRAHWLRYVLGSDPGELCARVNASLSHMVRGELARILARLPRALRLAAQELPGIGALREDPAHLGAWKRLAASTLTGGHWRQRLTARGLGAACEEGDGRTLFVVGDPMQSIYRFRDAEVGLFLRARDHGIGNVRLTPLRLARNFRATEPLVAWNNAVFERVFPADDDLRAGAIAFSASVARVLPQACAAGAAAPVRLRVFPDDPAGEAAAIVSRLVELRRDDPRGTVAGLVAA